MNGTPGTPMWRRFASISAGMATTHLTLFILKWLGWIDGKPSVEHGTVLVYLLICGVLVLHNIRAARLAKAEQVDRALTGVQRDVRCTKCFGSGIDPSYTEPDGSPIKCPDCDGFGHP